MSESKARLDPAGMGTRFFVSGRDGRAPAQVARRDLIYTESPGFCSTAGSSPPGYAVDLVALLKTQLTARPGLRLIVCVQKNPDFAPDGALVSALAAATGV